MHLLCCVLGAKFPSPPVFSVLPAGSVVVYDASTLHAGMHNDASVTRHMAYITMLGEKGDAGGAQLFSIIPELIGNLTLEQFLAVDTATVSD